MISPLCDENQESRMTDYYFYKYEWSHSLEDYVIFF